MNYSLPLLSLLPPSILSSLLPFSQLLEDLKQLIIYMDEKKGDPDAYLNVIDWTDQLERSGGELYSGETRGVVMCVGGSVLITNAYVTMATMRTLGCDLPIEIFHLGQEEISAVARGVLLTEFGDIMFIDGLELQYVFGISLYYD